MNKSHAVPFLDRIDKSGSCWMWTGYRDKNGYGHLTVDNINRTAHRYSWELVNGSIPDGLFVCHKCDNPSCVNPDHLFLGTQADNVKDCHDKGRSSGGSMPGETNPSSKITEDQAKSIFVERNRNRKSLGSIARQYGITEQMVWLIAKGKKWEWATRELV